MLLVIPTSTPNHHNSNEFYIVENHRNVVLNVSLRQSYDKSTIGMATILNFFNMVDTLELQRLALVQNIMVRSLSMPDTASNTI